MLDFITIPLATLFVAQSIKLITDKIKGNYDAVNLMSLYGGMPSSHTALVASLGTLIYARAGVDSIYFAIWFIISLIVIRDALGLRQEVSRHAEAISKIANTKKVSIPYLTKRLGHTPKEVAAGIVLGIVVTLILNYIFTLL